MNKAGVLKHISELIETLNKINKKLSRVFDYHEAMGIDLTKQNDQTTIAKAKKKHNQLDFVPLRSVYTSLFSTGLHLQNSLLRVRQLEKIFDLIEKRKYENNDVDSTDNAQISIQTGPTQSEIIQWLKGFEEIQGELNACVGCLEDGASNIDRLQNNDNTSTQNTGYTTTKTEDKQEDECKEVKTEHPVLPLVDNNDPRQHLDEVFEADMDDEDVNDGYILRNGKEGIVEDEEFQKKLKSEKRLMRELKTVLVAKQAEHEKREATALARQNGTSKTLTDNNTDNFNQLKHSKFETGTCIKNSNGLPGDAYSFNNGNTDIKSSPEIEEQNNEYSELVINCNQKPLDSPVCKNFQSLRNKIDPFSNNNGFIHGTSETLLTSKNVNHGFEDSFVPHINPESQLNLLENSGTINKSLALEAYLQDSINAVKNNSTGSMDLSPSSVNEETQTDTELTNGHISKKNSNSSCNSSRKYIKHIFVNQTQNEEEMTIRSDSSPDLSNEIKSNNYDTSKRRSRDLPHLQIEKNYSADESESASDSASSDQGTVKLKGEERSHVSNRDEELFSDEHISSNSRVIPRSISGQVLTDEDDENSFRAISEKEYINTASNDKMDNQSDSDGCTTSSSATSECSSDSSDDSEMKKGNSENYVELRTNEYPDSEIKTRTMENNMAVGSNPFSSPIESSITQSISSSEASSFVYKENPPTSRSNEAKPQVLRKDLPISMTSSFYSTICQSSKPDKFEETNCSLSDIRSVSTPDLKRLAIVTSTSSPYISLDDLTPKADDNGYENSSDDQSSCYSDTLNDSYLNSITADEIVDEGSIHSSTEWGSADELDHHVLKTYRRPLRPAANITPTDHKSIAEKKTNSISKQPKMIDTTTSKEKRKAKRYRNQSLISLEKGSDNLQSRTSQSVFHGSTSNTTKQKNADENCEQSDKKLYNSILETATQSVYLARKKKENGTGSLKISLPRNPIGFDSLLASQVAQKARNFTSGLSSKSKTEEVFGDPDSD